MRIEHRPSKPRVAGSNPAGRAIWFSPAGNNRFMVSVAQLVEPRIVIPVVVGSSPIVHPNFMIFVLALGAVSSVGRAADS